ncbi:hypothetical protein ANCCEY_10660 [Ancylostoma ceylanicum]|uniref:Nucleotide-diphospho-sugar transferase domain-containing protein n=1 Tax=Ancylostoma ceylanicum TaxID=53326 RepID=A0A0D6LDQ4_9BILA|nr:hypothetical protein ANCCEY_10660 [Ancylostoma ceylanicum]
MIISKDAIYYLAEFYKKSEYCYSLVHGTYETHRGAQEKVKCESETKKKPRPQIGVVEVLTAEASPEFYYTAICEFLLSLKTDETFRSKKSLILSQADKKFFRRHCVVARMLRYYDYVLFLDADIGVVNPSK